MLDIVNAFERSNYDLVTSTFGRPSDVDGNGQIVLLFTPLVDQLNSAGFFVVNSLKEPPEGSKADMLFLSPTQPLYLYNEAIVHEFQHLINYNEHVKERDRPREETWLDEALSQVAEDLAGGAVVRGNWSRIQPFMEAPHLYTLTRDKSDSNVQGLEKGHRGAAYLFLRSLMEASGQDLLGQLVQTPVVGIGNVEAATGRDFAELFREFAARLFLSGAWLNSDPAYNYTAEHFVDANQYRRTLMTPYEEILAADGTGSFSGTVNPAAAAFLRLTGNGIFEVEISTEVSGAFQALLIPLPKDFEHRLALPTHFFRSLVLDSPLPTILYAGKVETVSGRVLEAEIDRIAIQFTPLSGGQAIPQFTNVIDGRFTIDLSFLEAQVGSYEIKVGAGQPGNLPSKGSFAPVRVLPSQPDLAMPQEPIDFGEVLVGQTTAARRTVMNLGSEDLEIAASVDGSPPFSVVPNSFTLAPGAGQEVTVVFAPEATGSAAGMLRFTSNDPDQGVVTLALSGTGRQFTEVVNLAMSPVESSSSWGAAWGDYDNDGHLDLYVANEAAGNFLYHNERDGTLTEVGRNAGVDDGQSNSRAVAWGDYDDDGHLDLYVTNISAPNRLYRNNRDGTFAEVSVSARTTYPPFDSQAAAWGDYDDDGYLDLYVTYRDTASVLWRNNGNGTFSHASGSARVSEPGPGGQGMGAAWGDYNNDGHLDLFWAKEFPDPNKLYRNEGNGTFTEVGSRAGVEDVGNSRAAAWGDYDNDGHLDLFLTRGGPNQLYGNEGNETFTAVDAGTQIGGNSSSWGAAWGDYDNDGHLDLYVANESAGNFLYHNERDGTFAEVGAEAGVDPQGGRGVAWGDYDGDGDLDLFVTTGSTNLLYRNDGAMALQPVPKLAAAEEGSNHWLVVDLVGMRSDRSGIGARVTAVAGALQQHRHVDGGSGLYSQPSLPVEFGLGSATSVDRLTVYWPSGAMQELTDVLADQKIAIVEAEDSDRQPSDGSFTFGDVDGDGEITAGDAILVLRFAVGLEEPTPEQVVAADVDGDGEITSADAIRILEVASGERESFSKPVVVTRTSESQEVSIPEPSLSVETSSLRLTFEDLRHIAGGDLLVRYGAGLGAASSVHVRGWSAQALSAINIDIPGEVRISFVEPNSEVSGQLALQILLPKLDLQAPVQVDVQARFYGSGGVLVGEVRANPRLGPLPSRYALLQNYPNPFNPSTTIPYELPKPGQVVLQIFNLSGQLVRTLVESKQQAGHHRVEWDGRDERGHRVGSGVYLYRLRVDGSGYTAVRRMVFLE